MEEWATIAMTMLGIRISDVWLICGNVVLNNMIWLSNQARFCVILKLILWIHGLQQGDGGIGLCSQKYNHS